MEYDSPGRGGPDWVVRPLQSRESIELLDFDFFKIMCRVEAGEPILSSRTTFENDSPVSSLLLGSTEHSARGSGKLSMLSQSDTLPGLTDCEAQNPRMAGTADLYEESRLQNVNLEFGDALYSSIFAEPVIFSSLFTCIGRVNRAG